MDGFTIPWVGGTGETYVSFSPDGANVHSCGVPQLDALEAWFNKHASSLSIEAVLDFNEAMGWIPADDEGTQ